MLPKTASDYSVDRILSARDGARHVPADCWQTNRRVDELVVQAKPPAEQEKIPVLQLLRDFRTVFK